MKLATVNPDELQVWVEDAQDQFRDIEVYVTAQGYELRCGTLRPLQLDVALKGGSG